MSARVLIVEDDLAMAKVLRDNLTAEGYRSEHAADGRHAMVLAQAHRPDLVLLDAMLPDADGFDLIRALRALGGYPIIMLTARSQKSDKLRGLDVGADDYITKPFDLEELLARIRAVLRRSRPSIARLILGETIVDFVTQQARRGGRPVHLTDREFAILHVLHERIPHTVSRDELLRSAWGYVDMPLTRSVDHAIARLRRKVEPDAHRPRYIHTVYGDGYRLTPGPAGD